MEESPISSIYNILERISDGFVALDKNWHYVYVNRRAAEMFSRKPEELIGRHIWTELPEGIDQPFYKACYRAMEEQVTIHIEEYYPPWDRWFKNRIYPSADGLTIFFTEITERRKTEKALFEKQYLLSESQRIAHIGTWFYNLAGHITWSEEMYRIFGVSSDTFIPNAESFLNLVHPDDRAILRTWINCCIAEERPGELEFRTIMPDGTIRFISGRGELIYDAGKIPTHIAGTVQDITDRKQAEEEIRAANEKIAQHAVKLEEKVRERTAELEHANIKLKELDRLKSMFIASMSHELRTPLNSIIGFTGIILQGMSGDITEEQRKQLSIVQMSAKHLLALISDVIDVSKIEADKVELYMKEFDLSLLLRDVMESFSHAADVKMLKLSLDAPAELMVRSDERRIKQVLNNLLSNAVKFTDIGSIATKVHVHQDDNNIIITVKDTGSGIKEEDQKNLFKAFSKFTQEGGSKPEGTGLGLYLSQKIAGLLGGVLKAESEFGKGSTFTFIFPLWHLS